MRFLRRILRPVFCCSALCSRAQSGEEKLSEDLLLSSHPEWEVFITFLSVPDILIGTSSLDVDRRIKYD